MYVAVYMGVCIYLRACVCVWVRVCVSMCTYASLNHCPRICMCVCACKKETSPDTQVVEEATLHAFTVSIGAFGLLVRAVALHATRSDPTWGQFACIRGFELKEYASRGEREIHMINK